MRQKPGELFVIGATLYHRVTEQSGRVVKGTVLVFLPELIRATSAARDYAEYLIPFLIQDHSFPHLIPAKTGVPGRVLGLTDLIRGELPVGTDRARLCVTTYLKMMLVLLINHYTSCRGSIEVFSRKQEALDRLRPLFDFLDSNYGEPLTVQNGASVLKMSKSHFMRFFRQVTGQSFINYLNRFRVAKAQAMLVLPNKSIATVSQEVGFCDQSYFGVLFRRLVHMTPLQYRDSLVGEKEGRPPASDKAGGAEPSLTEVSGPPSHSTKLARCPVCGSGPPGFALPESSG
jgi:AraC-like DNA-binding protein